jgi:23S rRNA (guanosine2251-2'-O)-methyltransferase
MALVTDPHNVGAIIRSAAVFGIDAIAMPKNSSAKESAIMAKSASGALDIIPICYVSNISNIIKELKDLHFWIYCLSENGDKDINSCDLKGKTAIILGAEGSGARRLTIESSDFLVKLPSFSNFSTLNVSNAAAITFYEIYNQQNTN